MLLQAALNGPVTKADHPATPHSVDELVTDARRCVAAGAAALHLHPRNSAGEESLGGRDVDAVVAAVRAACGSQVPIGVSTGAWIEPDLGRRLALIAAWTAPDYASVNLGEAGAPEVMRALLDVGVGIEAGVWSVEDADRLAATGLAAHVTRVLIEPVDVGGDGAVACVDRIHDALDRHGITAPRLQHGDGEATWVLLRDAYARGLDSRIGLEDTRLLPDGTRCGGNGDLVAAASAIRDAASGPAPG